MGDFFTRLVERTWGVAPVVQPLIASRFVSEPTGHLPDIEWDDETKASDDLDRAQTPLTKETPPAPDGPTSWPEDAAVGHQENGSNVAPTTPKRPQRTLDTQSDPHYPADSASIELGVIPTQEDRQSLSPDTPSRRQRTLEKPESFHPAEPNPTWRGAPVPTSHHKLPEDSPPDPNVAEGVSGQAPSRTISSLVEQGRGATLPLQPLPITQGRLPQSKATLDRSAPSDTPLVTPRPDNPLVTPRLVGLQPDDRLEQGLQEPRKAVPEPSTPTIRVSIGRIEVRAITPSPTSPARRETPAQPSSALSLDDYLKQRNAGQR